jgi:hypothetical protein
MHKQPTQKWRRRRLFIGVFMNIGNLQVFCSGTRVGSCTRLLVVHCSFVLLCRSTKIVRVGNPPRFVQYNRCRDCPFGALNSSQRFEFTFQRNRALDTFWNLSCLLDSNLCRSTCSMKSSDSMNRSLRRKSSVETNGALHSEAFWRRETDHFSGSLLVRALGL